MEPFGRPASLEAPPASFPPREFAPGRPAQPLADPPPQMAASSNSRPTFTSDAWISAWRSCWHNGHLFLSHPTEGFIKHPTECLPPEYFFNPSTTYDADSGVYLTWFNGLFFLYTMRDNYGVLAFRVLPQTPQLANGAYPVQQPEQILGKRIFRDEQAAPPSKKVKRTAPIKQPGPTRIRRDRAVQTRVYDDIWKRIFEFSEPSMLFTFQRVSRGFHDALSYNHIWKNSMVSHFGADLPATPLPLQDWQYADLLSGQGCMSCGDHKARKTYWAFLRRWCTTCLMEKIIKHEDIAAVRTKYPGLFHCIPCATVDSWNHYSYAGYGDTLGRSMASGHQPIFLKDDVTKALQDYDDFLALLEKREVSEEDKAVLVRAWMQECREQTILYMDHRYQIDMWEKQWNNARAVNSTQLKHKRKEFIISKAAQLDPPIREDVLKLIPSYQENIKINKDFKTEKLWQVLRPKLLQFREKAEHIWRLEKEAEQTGYWDLIPSLQPMQSSRGLDLVSKLTERVVDKYEFIKVQGQGYNMPHQEFTLGILGDVWKAWYNLPARSKPGSQFPPTSPFKNYYPADGRYVLTIEHACRIVEYQINRKLSELYSEFRQPTRNVQKFRCPGCKRNDSNKKRTFRELMHHIRDDHANTVGDFDLFRLAGPKTEMRYLCAVPWPRNLPVLTMSQKSTGGWNLEDCPPDYTRPRTTAPTQQIPDTEPSAFARGKAAVIPNDISQGSQDFIGNMRFALQQLADSSLQPEIRSKIALEFGMQHWTYAYPNSTSVPDLHLLRSELETTLVSTNNHDIFNKLCCRACQNVGEGRTRGGKNFAKMPSTRNQLLTHFERDHLDSMKSWPNDLFALPTGSDVNRALRDAGPKAQNAFCVLFPPSTEYVFHRA